jgi:hypothetical protein
MTSATSGTIGIVLPAALKPARQSRGQSRIESSPEIQNREYAMPARILDIVTAGKQNQRNTCV